MTIRKPLAVMLALATLALAACAPPNYNVRAPEPSGLKYVVSGTPATTQFALIDERRADGRVFSSGLLPAELKIDGKPIDPVPFLASQLSAELASRGLPASVSATSTAPPVIRLKSYRIQNMRTSGYSPFTTLTFISADVDTSAGPKRIGAFVTRGKVPVWSFEEVIEPAFNQPLALGVREFAAKIANAVYGYRASDEEVKRLTEKIANRTPDSFIDVYALGFTNHPGVVDTLVKLTSDEQEYIRQAAISSLGTLGASGQFNLLQQIYKNPAVSWQDHCVALKSIADLGTPESKAFIEAEAKRLGTDPSRESQTLGQIIALYL